LGEKDIVVGVKVWLL